MINKYYLDEDELNCYYRFLYLYRRYKILYLKSCELKAGSKITDYYFENYIKYYSAFSLLLSDLFDKYKIPNTCIHAVECDYECKCLKIIF